MRKLIPAILGLLLVFFSFSAFAEENLLINGDFSAGTEDEAESWSRQMWFTDEGVSALTVESDGYDGRCISVSNVGKNDARFAQTVAVEPDTLYRISCMCRAEGVGNEGIGASISVADTFTYSSELKNTQGQWQRLDLVGRTGEDQTELTIFARVGGYGSENTGRAWFDDFEMVRLDEAPEGAVVHSFSSVSSQKNNAFTDDAAPEEPPRNTEMYVLLTGLYLLGILAAARKFRRNPLSSAAFYGRLFAAMMAGALILRLVAAALIPGYNTDINCFSSWGLHMAAQGPMGFYNSGMWCDYPPLYMWMLMPVGLLQSLLGLATRSGLQLILVKLWPILFDLASAYLIWNRARKQLDDRCALMLAAFFALNPAVIADSAAWGQIDSVFTFFVVLCALDAVEGRYITSLLYFTLSMLIKPQALLFAPLGLAAIIIYHVRSHEKPWKLCLGLAASLAILYAFGLISCYRSIDFSQGWASVLTAPAEWLVQQYFGTMQGYSKVTVNALNAYYPFGLNWKDTAQYPLVTGFAWVCFAASYVYCAVLCLISKDKHHLPLIGGLLIVLIYTFGPMIHERYIFPALLLLTVAMIYSRDKRILISVTLTSAALFLNIVLVLQGGMTPANFGHLQADENWLNNLLCALNVLNALFLAWTALDICVFGREYPLQDCEESSFCPGMHNLLNKTDFRLRMRSADYLAMAGMTALCAVISFTNLGSMKAPQTTWISSAPGEQVVFDLGQTERFRLTYYGGICNSNFTVELSNDGETWTVPYSAKYNQGEIFRWLWYVPQDASGQQVNELTVPSEDGSAFVAFAGYEGEAFPFQQARYVRLTAAAPGLKLSEVGFLNEEGHPLPIASVSSVGELVISNPELLTDEQDTIPPLPSYSNSTYFDEIYHARTAYEHLHGLPTYEWTHPPLGKVLMMVGIQLFGMTPFGWRFMGALMGVLMVPLMYLLVKQLTKSSKLSFIAMFLLAVDSMRFTQTRIATIDSYAVFWIMLMYFFMLRYCQMQWHSWDDFKHSLLPLGLCGVTMGVAWATKWIGLYASVGLAVLFFASLFVRWREYRCAAKLGSPEFSEMVSWFWTMLVSVIAFCLIFFVVIPVLIYYFSYYWHLQSEGVNSLADMFRPEYIRSVADLQTRIFKYHAGLGGDTHFFRSPWYQWPVIAWPMWYFSGTAYMPQGTISSISCMGNPAVWWFGLIALIFVAVRAAMVRRAPRSYVFVLIGFASQFLPWVLVPRSTFIYHYFASVPFIIMAAVLMLKWIRTRSKTAFRWISVGLMAAALILFIAFYPLESGLPVPRSYANYLRWFNWYNF